jgi:periplasmic divalent cation tolerance protein
MGWYAASDGSVRSKGTMYFVMHPHGIHASGRWVGLSYDGNIVTAPDPDWLVEFTRRLVTDRLCASGHNFQPIRTIYRWQGKVYDKTEGRVALRTRRSLLPQIIDRAKREHPYDVPSVVAIPIIDGGPDYIGWIMEQTESSER